MKKITLAFLLTICSLAAPHAQTSPAASRVTGTITLALDARETPRKLLHARETLNVTPGALTLVYPKWLPGEHAPDGAIDDLVGLIFTAGGKAVPWRRDPVDLFAFHIDIPQGSTDSTSRSISSPPLVRAASARHHPTRRTLASIRGTRCCSIRRAH